MTDDDLWGLVDYAPLGALLAPAGRDVIDAVEPLAGMRVLDVAAGLGHMSAAAADRGATVTAVDASPRMVTEGRARTTRSVRWLGGDLAALPVPDGSADIAISSFGLIFAARPGAAVAELRRALVPGGRVGFSTWSGDSLMARMARAMAEIVPPPAADDEDRSAWGEPSGVTRLLSDGGFADVRVATASLPWRFDSPEAMSTFLRRHSPAHVASARAAGDRSDTLFAAIEAVFAPEGGPVDRDVEYLVVTARRA